MLRLLIVFLFLSQTVWAQEAPGPFLEGVKAYQGEDYQKANELFAPLVAEHPENPVLLYNLGLANYHLGHFGLALGLWRKARFLDEDFQPVQQAITFTEERLFPNQNPETFIVSIYHTLQKLPLWFWCGLSLISFFAAGFLILEYGVKKQLGLSLWPTWVVLLIPLFLFTSYFAIDSYLTRSKTMATIIEKNRLTHANPSETSPTLSELEEGQIVSVEKVYGDWVQIRSLTGAPGWVPGNSLIIFKGQ